MSGHTPGPWEISGDDLNGFMIVGPKADGFPAIAYDAKCKADAELIAAAPDLAEALKLLLAEVAASGNAEATNHGWPKAVAASHAALARAVGDAK